MPRKSSIFPTPETSEASEALLLLHDCPLTPQGQGTNKRTPKKPDAKRKLDLDNLTNAKKTRIDSSLSALTKRFVDLIPNGGSLDLNNAARSLEVQKRRIYDITNVLEGIGVLTKKSKNNIQWSDKLTSPEGEKKKKKLEREVAKLSKEEEEIDAWINSLETSMRSITGDKRWAYVTHSDIRSLENYSDRTLLLIKAPPNTSLTVPPPDMGLQMHMKSEGGEIGVYLCPEEDSSPTKSIEPLKTPTPSPQLTPIKKYINSAATTPSPVHYKSTLSSPPQSSQQMPSSDGDGFLSLEYGDPVYNFTLAENEGLCDLFDL